MAVHIGFKAVGNDDSGIFGGIDRTAARLLNADILSIVSSSVTGYCR
jgi:hypothetical protein